jgi:hypothetical protein
VLILILSCGVISFGIWNAGLPLGDEAGYIETARNLASEGKYTSNLYLLSYALIFKFTSMEPASAHYLLRYATSLLSTVLIYLLLKSMKFAMSEFIILIVCIFWMNCLLNIPYVQYGNINLFAMNIALIPVIYLIRKQSLNSFIICLASFLWCSKIRPEYILAVFLLLLYFGFIYFDKIFHADKQKIMSSIRSSFLSLLILVFTLFTIFSDKSQERDFDKYMLQVLSQCYTFLYAKMNPDISIDPMQEHSAIIDEVFDHPSGFIDAFRKNPLEIITYFALNGSINTLLLVPSLVQHRPMIPISKLPEIYEILFILFVPVCAVAMVIRRAFKGISFNNILSFLNMKLADIPERLQIRGNLIKRMDITVLIILSSSSIVSIFLAMPDPRCWVTCIPLALFWFAWGYSYMYSNVIPAKFKIKQNDLSSCPQKSCFPYCMIPLAVFLIFAVYMSRPKFLDLKSNKVVIDAIRKSSAWKKKPVIAGSNSISVYAVMGECERIGLSALSTEMFKSGYIDYFVVDINHRISKFWAENREFMENFEADPGTWGYMNMNVENSDGLVVYAKKQTR